ncbi:hypothetical protein CLOM621_08104 [Clostridium sp. M62/1]|nr:hypothetical protein CLOM621_08104 [Clostridium sp. M62/1]
MTATWLFFNRKPAAGRDRKRRQSFRRVKIQTEERQRVYDT